MTNKAPKLPKIEETEEPLDEAVLDVQAEELQRDALRRRKSSFLTKGMRTKPLAAQSFLSTPEQL